MKKTTRLIFSVLASFIVLQLTGCVTPPSNGWVQVCKGMDRDMVHALLGEPKFANLDGLEEVYAQPVLVEQNTQTYSDTRYTYVDTRQQMSYRELHVQYNGGGIVVRAFQLVVRN